LAGFVAIGVAVVALGLGVFTLTSNGASPRSQGRPPTTTTNPPTTTTTRPTTTHGRPTTTTPFPSGQTTTVAPPPTSTTAPSLQQTVTVRVYNNSTIKGLAAMAAADIRSAGFNVVQVGSYPGGVISHSTAYYTTLPGEQQIANEIGKDFNIKVMPRFPGIAFASPGVIVIVTKDFQVGGK
jgi:hypothetical protein